MEFMILAAVALGGIKPTVSFCQAIPWWKFCRPDPRAVKKVVRPIIRK